MKRFHDLFAYEKSFELSMRIFELSKVFPKEETYSLIDQIRRSSRSVSANLTEAYAKSRYLNILQVNSPIVMLKILKHKTG